MDARPGGVAEAVLRNYRRVSGSPWVDRVEPMASTRQLGRHPPGLDLVSSRWLTRWVGPAV